MHDTDGEHIDATALPEEERVALAQRFIESMTEESAARHDALLDRLSDDETTLTTEWYGDDLAEAQGRAYKTRDTIEQATGRHVEVSHTGKSWNFPETTYYEFELIVEPAP